MDGRVTEAIEYSRQMQTEGAVNTSNHNEQAQWEVGEWSRKQYSRGSSEHPTQVFTSDARRG